MAEVQYTDGLKRGELVVMGGPTPSCRRDGLDGATGTAKTAGNRLSVPQLCIILHAAYSVAYGDAEVNEGQQD